MVAKVSVPLLRRYATLTWGAVQPWSYSSTMHIHGENTHNRKIPKTDQDLKTDPKDRKDRSDPRSHRGRAAPTFLTRIVVNPRGNVL